MAPELAKEIKKERVKAKENPLNIQTQRVLNGQNMDLAHAETHVHGPTVTLQNLQDSGIRDELLANGKPKQNLGETRINAEDRLPEKLLNPDQESLQPVK